MVVGDVMLDVVARPVAVLAPTSDTPARVRVGRGGAGANLAVALARTGHDVTYLGAAGRDLAATTFLDDLRALGVRVHLERVESSTGVVIAIVDADGQRAMLSDRGANRLLSCAHVLDALDAPFDHLHVSGYTLLDEATRAVGVAALRRAFERSATTSVDVCSVGPLLDVTPEVFVASAAGASMLFANEEEAFTLSGETTLEAALDALGASYHEVVVTRGAKGARARCGNDVVDAVSLSGDVLDTTGAGDAATGTYLGARLNGHAPAHALEDAMRAASAVVGVLGSFGVFDSH